jgi:SAM-dependent methyltransferase
MNRILQWVIAVGGLFLVTGWMPSGAIASAWAQAGGEEVPFITTPDAVTLAMLMAAQTRPGDHVIDLGSGDGRIVITAAKRFGATGLGVDIVPDLVRQSRRSAEAAGVGRQVEFRVEDLFTTDLSRASVITMYLLPEFNLRLRPALLALTPGTRIVSHDWDMGDWQPDRTLTLPVPDKAVGREKLSRVHLWWVPARVQGHWCAPGGQHLELRQQHQVLSGWLSLPVAGQPPERHSLNGRLRGAQLELHGLQWQLQGHWHGHQQRSAQGAATAPSDTAAHSGTSTQHLSLHLQPAGAAATGGDTPQAWAVSPDGRCPRAATLTP